MDGTKSGITWEQRMWGRMRAFDVPARVVSLVFVVASVAAMSFCQLGFWNLGVFGQERYYVFLMLAPLTLGGYMFGPYTGGLLGFYTGAVLLAHATFLPLDFTEIYFMSATNTLVLLPIFGAVAGKLFDLALRSEPQGMRRTLRIIAVCEVVSLATNLCMTAALVMQFGGLAYLGETAEAMSMSLGFMIVQALTVDSLLGIALCLCVDYIFHAMAARGSYRKLAIVFRNWLVLVMSIVFMIVSAVIFSVVTVQERSEAKRNIVSELEYLQEHLNQGLEADPKQLLVGYDTEVDGVVVITDNEGIVLASDDEARFPEGTNVLAGFGYGIYADDPEALAEFFSSDDKEEAVVYGTQDSDENGEVNMDFALMGQMSFEGGHILLRMSPNLVFADRFATMVALTALAAGLVVAATILATILLKRVVVQHLDETNESLAKITAGDLEERVALHDTVELTSLAKGINTTVVALEDTIDEIERRNAADLLTATKIQESNLPHEFPPFPHIERFSIFASMNAAKEVGGDFYDFFEMGESRIGFLIADVSGKGIPGALFMMAAKNEIKHQMTSGKELAAAIRAANVHLCANNEAGMFVTVWAAVLNWQTGELTYCNAGHNFPLLRHGRKGTWEWLNKKCGLFLGTFEVAKYRQETLMLEPGDELVLYTDGVNEAFSLNEVEYGNDRLEQFLQSHNDLRAEQLVPALRGDVAKWAEGAEQSDDVTILALEYGV